MPVKNQNFNLTVKDRRAAIAAAVAERPAPACAHHWKIDSPNGEYSSGVCKRCGVSRGDFRNSVELSFYGDFERGGAE